MLFAQTCVQYFLVALVCINNRGIDSIDEIYYCECASGILTQKTPTASLLWEPQMKKKKDRYLSKQQAGNQATDANGDKGGDEAGELEGVVDDVLTDMRGASSVEADSGYLRRVVRQEEIAVDRRKERQQNMRRQAERQTDRIQGLRRCSLREEHDAKQEQRYCEKDRPGREDTGYGAHDGFMVTEEESASHPCHAED